MGFHDLKSPKAGSGRVLSERQLFRIQICIFCALGLIWAGSSQGLPPLCFHLDRINANLQEKISDQISSEHKTIPNIQWCLLGGTHLRWMLGISLFLYHWWSPQGALCITIAISQVRKKMDAKHNLVTYPISWELVSDLGRLKFRCGHLQGPKLQMLLSYWMLK